ncbi:MAG: replication initiator protein A [Gammaproteobacteria bacterium]|nr:replication initiator protein A [Gammaproteobacteria bacterium]
MLMAYPFFSLAKTPRITPIRFQAGRVTTRVAGTLANGMATIWDADVLIWVTSQIVGARNAGLPTSRLVVATPYDILTYIRRGTSQRDYERLRSALDRLQSTSVATSLRQPDAQRLHRFSWLNEWRGGSDQHGRSLGVELTLPDWLYQTLLEPHQVLRIDPRYFHLTGGIERWLYRLVRKHGGRQPAGWRFDFEYLYRKSGSSAQYADFAGDLRRIARQGRLPGYTLAVSRSGAGRESMAFAPARTGSRTRMQDLVQALRSVDKL